MKELMMIVVLFLTGFAGFMTIWFLTLSLMAWLTMLAWNFILVGIIGVTRSIDFWEAFVVYIAIAAIAALFRSSNK